MRSPEFTPIADMSLDQLRNRLTDKLAHLTQRQTVIDDLPENKKILNSIKTEIVMTHRRLSLLNEKASKGKHE